MEGLCPQCGVELESSWSFCPHCGAASKQEVHSRRAPEEREWAPARGAYGGLLFGVLAAPILIIPGTLMCFTGLGAFLGVPMIVAGILAPLAGPLIGFGALKGKCPWCGTPVTSIGNAKEIFCHACSQRILVTHHEFVRPV